MPTVLLPVPHCKQEGPHNCLPACARMVLRYLGQEVSEAELAAQLGTTELGTPGNRLLRLSSSTLHVDFGPLTLSLVYNKLNAGTPIITLARTLFLDYWQADLAHAVVVVGYDDEYLLLNDPEFEDAPQRATPDGFLAAWGEFDHLAGIISKL
jgi:ABC-type bacteriocin/lantibiotic exporter with double-glycine peptidase domain